MLRLMLMLQTVLQLSIVCIQWQFNQAVYCAVEQPLIFQIFLCHSRIVVCAVRIRWLNSNVVELCASRKLVQVDNGMRGWKKDNLCVIEWKIIFSSAYRLSFLVKEREMNGYKYKSDWKLNWKLKPSRHCRGTLFADLIEFTGSNYNFPVHPTCEYIKHAYIPFQNIQQSDEYQSNLFESRVSLSSEITYSVYEYLVLID